MVKNSRLCEFALEFGNVAITKLKSHMEKKKFFAAA